jgi:hypothetical protein
LQYRIYGIFILLQLKNAVTCLSTVEIKFASFPAVAGIPRVDVTNKYPEYGIVPLLGQLYLCRKLE